MTARKEIPQTIKQQLYGMGTMQVMSWGAHNWSYGEDEKKNTYLSFKVQGFKFKGIVRITYIDGVDVYRLDFYKRNEIKHTVEDVYFDEMNNIIDRYVETDNGKSDQYKKKVEKKYKIS